MNKDVTATDFHFRLNAERDALKAFVTLLKTEQQELIDGHIERLMSLSESKTQAVHRLSKLASSRRDEMIAHAAEIKARGVDAWVQDRAPGSLPVWREILRLAEELQYLNRINGTLIQTRLRHNQQALMALHNAANGAHVLYGADGQPHLPSSGRILGSV